MGIFPVQKQELWRGLLLLSENIPSDSAPDTLGLDRLLPDDHFTPSGTPLSRARQSPAGHKKNGLAVGGAVLFHASRLLVFRSAFDRKGVGRE